MKSFSLTVLLFAVITVGCAHAPQVTSSHASPATSPQPILIASTTDEVPPKTPEATVQSPETQVNPEKEPVSDETSMDYTEESKEPQAPTISDPIEPFNRAMFEFNDRLYFWLLKPVAQGYKAVVPEEARVSVKNFFSNLGFPIRFVSCLLQADASCAATEVGRFAVNTIWGIGGLMDPASSKDLNLQKQEVDLGQTLGVWGIGHGFYIVWPLAGPSSVRDSIDIAGEYFLYPPSYMGEIAPWYVWPIVRTYEEVNRTSLRIGDYEALKEAAIDPYVALRDAYVQYRSKKVRMKKGGQTDELAPSGIRMER
jgi:phospholipid-binding lipoprotein MlaA